MPQIQERPLDATAPDVAALHAQLARMSERLDEIAAESQRSRERWEAAEELLRDLTPFVRLAVDGITAKLAVYDERGYGEVIGASVGVLDRIVQSFDREGVEAIGDNILLLLKTIRSMS